METIELKEMIADLTIENERIKNTSKSRFNQNKELKKSKLHLELLTSRFNNLKAFLDEHGFQARYYEGRERIDFSLFNALRGLIAKDKKLESVSVDGIYAVKIDGVYKIAKIHHNMCWRISFSSDDFNESEVLHFYNATDFTLLELL